MHQEMDMTLDSHAFLGSEVTLPALSLEPFIARWLVSVSLKQDTTEHLV